LGELLLKKQSYMVLLYRFLKSFSRSMGKLHMAVWMTGYNMGLTASGELLSTRNILD